MICKKCKTSIPPKSANCPICNDSIRGVGRRNQALAALLILIVITGAVYLFFSFTGRIHLDRDEDDEDFFTEIFEIPYLSLQSASTESAEYSQYHEDSQPELDVVFLTLQEIAIAAQLYAEGGYFITNRGFLYNLRSGSFVTADMLGLDIEGPAPMILYLRPVDFVNYGQGGLGGNYSREFYVYAAVETPRGVALYGPGHGHGYVFREHLNSILARFDYDHGEIHIPGDYLSQEFLTLAAAFSFSQQGYDIRWLRADEKYAFALMSERDGELVRAFVFEYIGNQWIIATGDLDGVTDFRLEISRLLPDFNPGLLPDSLEGIESEESMPQL